MNILNSAANAALAYIPTLSLLNGTVLFASLVLFAVLAFFSYKLFTFEIIIIGATFGFWIGSVFIPDMLGDWLSTLAISSTIQLESVLGLVFALILALLVHLIKNFALFISGAAFGGCIGYSLASLLAMKFSENAVFSSKITFWGIVVVCAIVLGLITIKLFKPIFIILTSLASGTLFAIVTFTLIIATGAGSLATLITFLICAVLGLILGFWGIIYQFSSNKNKAD